MATRTLVIHPVLASRRSERSLHAALEEAVGLAQAIALEVRHAAVARLQKVTPATYIGKGKMQEFAAIVGEHRIQLAIMDCALTPVQQRNLEENLGCKVIDRTALILEIFGARAKTAEGKLQVELASLSYQKGRLVRSWTHLERQRGGFGFLGGPGETQIEVDRRMISDRIAKIKRELTSVTRTRELHRATRREVPYPTVALVGYTNAGKSTLFNRLTGAKVVVKDLLFATLDPTIREVKLPSGTSVLLSDTVGFISNLPTELVAAFRATLEEVVEADLLLHVRDISHDDTAAQKQDVLKVLRQLFGKEHALEHIIEVHNKADLWREMHGESYQGSGNAIAVSALTGEGCEELLRAIDESLAARLLTEHRLRVAHSNGRAMAWLYANGQVLSRKDKDEEAVVTVRLSPANAERFKRQFKHK